MGKIISSNKGKYSEYGLIDGNKELMFTPDDTAKIMMDWILPQIDKNDTILEPFKGDGALYDLIPNNKSYCEIDDGLDFLTYTGKTDWAISNPPFRMLKDGEPINAFILIINRLMDSCNKGFFLLINHKLWSSLTVKRLRDWGVNDWAISKIKILEVKKWYGRYYLVKFEKNGDSLVDYA